MGSNKEINQEYLIYDTLSLIGTIGGTLGLFVGFSFYDFFVMILSFTIKKVKVVLFLAYQLLFFKRNCLIFILNVSIKKHLIYIQFEGSRILG